MSIEEFSKKQVFGSVEKGKMPGPLTDYNCDLVIEEYAPVPPQKNTSQKLYLNFTPKKKGATPFRI